MLVLMTAKLDKDATKKKKYKITGQHPDEYRLKIHKVFLNRI